MAFSSPKPTCERPRPPSRLTRRLLWSVWTLLPLMASCDRQLSRFDRQKVELGGPVGRRAFADAAAKQAPPLPAVPLPPAEPGTMSGSAKPAVTAPAPSVTPANPAILGTAAPATSAIPPPGLAVPSTMPVAAASAPVFADLTSLTATTGSAVGTVAVTVGIAVNAAYSRLDIRRAVGTVPPDCPIDLTPATGAIVRSLQSGFASETFIDVVGAASQTVTYRACLTGTAGEALAGQSTPTAVSRGHLLFHTSQSVAANFGGLAAADAICQAASVGAGSLTSVRADTGPWRAVLSTATVRAIDRLQLIGAVYQSDATTLIAPTGGELWTNTVTAPATRDETGALPGAATPWTGTLGNGTADSSNDCGGWSTTVGTARLGNAALGSGNAWLAASLGSCAASQALYCLSQPTAILTASSPGSYTVDLNLTVPAALPSDAVLTVQRRYGATPPDATCSDILAAPLSQTFATLPGTAQNYVDAEGLDASHALVSYRACLFDREGNVITSQAIAGVTVQP